MPAAHAQLVALSVDFTRAPLEIREALSYTPDDVARLLGRTAGTPGLDEAAIVSTCNRTEFYLAVHEPDADSRWLEVIRRDRPNVPAHDATCRLSRLEGPDAARHLFRVVCGLESQVLGDAHITGQVRRAFAQAGDARALGPTLSETLRLALSVSRCARATTDIARGSASLGAAVADAVSARCEAAGEARVLIVGAGAIARECARYLAKRATGTLQFVNRTPAAADRLAHECGGTARPWTALGEAAAAADVVVSAVRAESPILSRREGPSPATGALVIDLGVPRNVEPGYAAQLVTIDDIVTRCDDSMGRRRRAVEAVEALVERQVARWMRWRATWGREAVLKTLFVEEWRRRAEFAATVAPALGLEPTALHEVLRRFSAPLLRSHARALRALDDEPGADRSADRRAAVA